MGSRSRSLTLGVAGALVASAMLGCASKGGGSGPRSGCELPTSGSGRVRFVNAGTSGAGDLCVRASGASDWGSPVLASGGSDGLCASGLGYAQATLAFAVPAGSIDVKTIPHGSTCGADATSALDGTAIGALASGAPTVTLVRLGGGSSAERLVALPEEAAPRPGVYQLRLVNALSGNDAINMGLVASAALPATVQGNAFAQGVPPGSAAPPGSGPLGATDSSGYTALLLEPLHVGVAYAAETAAIFIVDTPVRSDRKTLFAIGDPSDAAHPPRGLYCEDTATPSAADGGASGDDALLASCTLTTTGP